MSMKIDNESTVQLVQHSPSDETAQKQAKLGQESMNEWLHASVIQILRNYGNTQERKDEDGDQDVAPTGPISMEALRSKGHSAINASTLSAISASTLGVDITSNTSNYLDEGLNDPDLIALFNANGNGATEGANSNNPVFGNSGIGEETSIYSLSAIILLLSMENKRNIIANRLDQIETANSRVQAITNEVADLKAIGSNLKVDGTRDKHKGDVPLGVFREMYENNYDANGKLDYEGSRTFLAGVMGKDLNKNRERQEVEALLNAIQDPTIDDNATEFEIPVVDDKGNIKNVKVELKLNHKAISDLAEKLTAQSEAISTQNQTRNIKLQQQISELQVTTQMCSAIIDHIKTLGSGIAQRI